MEGTDRQIIIIRRAPGPYGASPTQPYKCGQNVKIKTNAFFLYARYGGYRPCGTLTAATKRCTPSGCKVL